jgi:hypothetical protein
VLTDLLTRSILGGYHGCVAVPEIQPWQLSRAVRRVQQMLKIVEDQQSLFVAQKRQESVLGRFDAFDRAISSKGNSGNDVLHSPEGSQLDEKYAITESVQEMPGNFER